MSDSELQRHLLATFATEAEERLAAMSASIAALSSGEGDAVESLFREAHNLKGAARAVDMEGFEAVCQVLESVLSDVKRDRLVITEELAALLQQAVDELAVMLTAGERAAPASDRLLRRLHQVIDGTWSTTDRSEEAEAQATEPRAAPPVDASPPPLQPGPVGGSVRVATGKLEAVMRQVEGLLEPRLEAERLAVELRDVAALAAVENERRSRMHSLLRHLERRMPAVSEHLSASLRQVVTSFEGPRDRDRLEARLAQLRHGADDHVRTLRRLGASLYSDVKELQAVAFSSILEPLARNIRELARGHGKDVRLVIEGAEIHVDRGVLEEVKDPLLHLLRNAIDHGVEPPDVRARSGKPRQGTILVRVAPKDSAKVELVVSDDGAGMDFERLRQVVQGSPDASEAAAPALSERDLTELAFRSGVTTSPIITDLSGRGLGLAIVRERVERIGGNIDVESRRGEGAAFRLTLPLTLALFRGVAVRLGRDCYVVPSAGVERVLRVREDSVTGVGDRQSVEVDGATLTWARLDALLGLPSGAGSEEEGWAKAVVLAGPPRVALQVDEILGEQEVLVKPLGPQLARVRHIAGATVLPNGQVAPVLNVADLLQTLTTSPRSRQPSGRGGHPDADATPRRVLVVEDSITSRSLFKGILQAAGYSVTTAVDGIDALLKLEAEPIDLIVTDVDMPRLNGLELTTRVRAERRFTEVPVILITSLASPLDIERGVEAGANAYIVKSEFDQRGMLDAVRRLIG